MLPKYLWRDTPPHGARRNFTVGFFKSKGKAIKCPVLFSIFSRMFCWTSQAFPWEAGRVQQFCWVTQRGHKSFQANMELYFSRCFCRENTSLCKKVLLHLGAQVAKSNRKSHCKSNHTRSGSSTNCYRALKFAGLGAQPSFATFSLGKAPHKVHRGFPQVRDCRIQPHGQQGNNLDCHFGKIETMKS